MPGRTINNLASASAAGPSRKRHRQEDNDSETEVIEVQRARSNLQHDSRKRARVSLAGPSKASRPSKAAPVAESSDENDEDEDEEEDDENTETGRDRTPDSPPRTQYELKRDNGFRHLGHEAEDDQRATQRLLRRPQQLGDNHEAENGILEYLECFNFMCHEHLRINFGPLLNFIVGENGSGKSAVLTGITLCLGGKASSTNRGGSLKSFVKEGTEKSLLRVAIKNQGESAYKHEIYGDTIIVERHFSKVGNSSGFKVKSATGSVISTKKSEVGDIIEYYALQVDNPLNVLSQDNARQFLNAASKAQKYKFFVEGIQLQQLDDDYSLVQEYIEQIDSRLPDLEDAMKTAREKYQKAKEVKQAIQGIATIRAKQKTLFALATWVQVRDMELQLDARQKVVDGYDEKIADCDAKIEKATQALEAFKARLAQAEGDLEAARDAVAEKQGGVDAGKEKFDAMTAELTKVLADERACKGELTMKHDIVKDLEEQIAAEKRRLEESRGDAVERKHDELSGAKTQVETLEQQLKTSQSTKPDLIKSQEQAKAAAAEAMQSLKAKRDDVQKAETAITRLEQSAAGKYDGFEAGVPQLLRAIANDNRFERKPIGPVGAHIQLLKPRWSPILESTLNLMLGNFIVHSRRDANLLKELINRANLRHCGVTVKNFDTPLNTAGKEPDPKFDTILRVLKIDNDIVRDALIINNSIEQILLIENRKEAEQVMFSGNPPRNVKACLAYHDGKRGAGLNLSNHRGNTATQPIETKLTRKPRMQTDSSSTAAIQREALQQLHEELKALDQEKRRLDQDVQRCQRDLGAQKKEEETLKNQLRKAQATVLGIEAEIDQFEGADSRFQALEVQRKEAEQQMDFYGKQYGQFAITKQEKNQAAATAKRELKALRAEMAALGEQLQVCEDLVAKFSRKRDAAVAEKNIAFSEGEVCREDKMRAIAKRDAARNAVEEVTAAAIGCEPHRPELLDSHNRATIDKQLIAINEQIEKHRKKHGMSEEQVAHLCAERRQEYSDAVTHFQEAKGIHSQMEVSMDLRLSKWRLFQRLISAAARTHFSYLLTERRFRGKMIIDHTRKTLDLTVEPDIAEKKIGGRTTKTLSGGEKSFSSICMLLSIWDAMGSPLRCLDEFDVFMDNVNRRISTDMLIKTARRSVNRQYIFITPNAINNLDKDVKIHRMTDPRQRTLPQMNSR